MFLNQEKEQVLRDFGIKVVNDDEVKVLYQGRKLPRIAFLKSKQVFCIYYQGPDDVGQQSFEFDYDEFVFWYNEGKKFENMVRNEYAGFVLKYFSLNPSFLRRLGHKKKRCNKLLMLKELSLREFKKG